MSPDAYMKYQIEQLHKLFREIGIDQYTHGMPPMGEEDMGPHYNSYVFKAPLAENRKVNGKMCYLRGDFRIHLNSDTNYITGVYFCHVWFPNGRTDEIRSKDIMGVKKFIEKYEHVFNPKIKIQKRFDL